MKKLLIVVLISTTVQIAGRADHKVSKLCFEIQRKITFIRDSAQITSLSPADVDTLHAVNRQLQRLQYKVHKQLHS